MTDRPTIIEIRDLEKRFGSVAAVDTVNLDIRAGEFFALLGPSGCGKTTLLRMLAGLEIPTAGSILIDGQDMSRVPANRRPVNMVFQSYAVFPHMSVRDNVGYGLRVEGRPGTEIAERSEEALSLVKLDGLGDRKPDQLSGGQRQRVALARALVKRPKVLLLDEPLSALDAKLREQMRLELVNLQETVGITFIVVTHDQDEALAMADRIAVMDKGVVKQIAPPSELYEFPTNRFVADFIGSVNMFEGTVLAASGGEVTLEAAGFGSPVTVRQSRMPAERSDAWLAVRPEKIELSAEPVEADMSLEGIVEDITYLGGISVYHIRVGGPGGQLVKAQEANVDRVTGRRFTWDDTVYLHWSRDCAIVLEE